ncbi:pancreatic polypeptide receptor [Branchiostoma belcheri]|nr:pancreatic polypeptide receptor [Branchiostoma belcheri]
MTSNLSLVAVGVMIQRDSGVASLYKTYYIFVLVCEFILPVLIMSYCYIRIACKIWNRSVPGHHTQSQEEAIISSYPGITLSHRRKLSSGLIHELNTIHTQIDLSLVLNAIDTQSQEEGIIRSKRRGVRLLIIILILFVLCWGPFYGYAIVRDFFHDILSTQSKRRGVRLLIIILILFVLCWGPFYGYAIVRDFFHDILSKTELNFTLHFVMESLAMSNSMINTIVYTVMNDNVRKYAKKLAKELRDKWRNRKHRRVGVNPVNTVSTIAVAFENGGRSSPRGPRRAALFGPGDPGRVVPRAVGPRDVLGQADRGFQYREGRRTGQGHRTIVAPLEMRTHSELSSVEMV